MPATKSHIAYPQSREVMQQALESPKGVRLSFSSEKAAKAFRFNCYTVRKRDREQLMKTLPVEHPNWGLSPFDALSFDLTEVVGESGGSGPWLLTISTSGQSFQLTEL